MSLSKCWSIKDSKQEQKIRVPTYLQFITAVRPKMACIHLGYFDICFPTIFFIWAFKLIILKIFFQVKVNIHIQMSRNWVFSYLKICFCNKLPLMQTLSCYCRSQLSQNGKSSNSAQLLFCFVTRRIQWPVPVKATASVCCRICCPAGLMSCAKGQTAGHTSARGASSYQPHSTQMQMQSFLFAYIFRIKVEHLWLSICH